MNVIDPLTLQRAAEAIGWALIHLLWQGALIGAGLYLALSLLRRSTSSARYLASCAALLLMLVLPAGTAWVAYQRSESSALAEAYDRSPILAGTASPSVPATLAAAPARFTLDGAGALVRRNLPLVVAVWLLGVVLLSFRLLFDWAKLRRLVMAATPLHDWMVAVERLRQRVGVVPRVWILRSDAVDVPTVIGWFRPVILMPISAVSGLTPEQIESVIAHELAHIRRHDFLVNMIQTAVETLLFYHPATWWISRQIRTERENCCDDLAVQACGDPVLYARALATLEGLRRPLEPSVAANGGSLLSRVRRLLGRSSDPGSRWTSGVVLLVLLAAVFIAAPVTVLALKPRLIGVPASTNVTVTAARLSAVADEELAEARAEEAERLAEAVAEAEAEERDETLEALSELDEIDFEDILIDAQLPLEAIVALKTHDVSAEYIAAMKAAGLAKLTVGDITAMAAHGVTTEYIDALKAQGFAGVDVDDVVTMAVHGIDAATIEELRKLGFGITVPEDAVEMAVHDVTPEFIRSVRATGLEVDRDTLLAMRIHGVSPEDVKAWREAGLGTLEMDTILSFAIHGLDPEEVSALQSLGLKLTVQELQAFAVHGIDADFVREMRDAGYSNLTAKELIDLAVAGVDGDYIREMRK